tara:strand:+ start:7795 stop:8088 length:294 start_codon:yes stop_codon:yes gene_type:complete
MNNHINLLGNQIGGNQNKELFNGGFPNLVLNNQKNRKIEYKYNIETNINRDIINIKNILEKRKEEQTPLINLIDNTNDTKRVKYKEEITNININKLN